MAMGQVYKHRTGETMNDLFVAVGDNPFNDKYSIIGICDLQSKAITLCKSDSLFNHYYIRQFKLNSPSSSRAIWSWSRYDN